jgi:hypothetical protein
MQLVPHWNARRAVKALSFAGVFLLCLSSPEAWAASDSVAKLQHTPVFALGGIGVAGTMSEGERALRAVLQESAATTQLEALLHTAAPAGQLYALLGLRVHDRAAYTRALQDFSKPEMQVETIGGCIVSHAPFRELLQRIEAGDYDKALARPAW